MRRNLKVCKKCKWLKRHPLNRRLIGCYIGDGAIYKQKRAYELLHLAYLCPYELEHVVCAGDINEKI